MAVKLLSTGGGSVTLDVPSTASDFALTVPASSATLLTNQTTGTILQVVTATTDIQTTVSSTSYQPTSLSCAINKQFSNSNILVITSAFIMAYISSAGDTSGNARIYETQASREVFDFRTVVRSYDGGDVNVSGASMSLSCLDTQSGTGSRVYRVDLKKVSGTDVRLNLDTNGQCVSTITLLEIVA